jgi:hypothetical protein
MKLEAVIDVSKGRIVMRKKDAIGDYFRWRISGYLPFIPLDDSHKKRLRVSSDQPLDDKKYSTDISETNTLSALQQVRLDIQNQTNPCWRCPLYWVNLKGMEKYLFQAKITCENPQKDVGGGNETFFWDMTIEKDK